MSPEVSFSLAACKVETVDIVHGLPVNIDESNA